jgi:hypothetical protein
VSVRQWKLPPGYVKEQVINRRDFTG